MLRIVLIKQYSPIDMRFQQQLLISGLWPVSLYGFVGFKYISISYPLNQL